MEVISRIVRKLDKMIKNESIVNVILSNLFFKEDELALSYMHRLQDTDMTLDILTKTGVGIVINKIRKQSANAEINTLGKQLIKQWKKLVPGRFFEVQTEVWLWWIIHALYKIVLTKCHQLASSSSVIFFN